MISRSEVESFARSHSSFFNNNYNEALTAEACFLFENGMSNNLDDDTRLWLQTYLPASNSARSRLSSARNSAFQASRAAR